MTGRFDSMEMAKKIGCDCHCHNDCQKCKESSIPNRICIHCKPDEFKEDKDTPIRNEIHKVVAEGNWMHEENCGWNYYGHEGYYCGCGMETSNKETTEELLKIFKKYSPLTLY